MKNVHIYLCGSKLHTFKITREITKLTTKFLKSSKRSERPIL